MMKAEVIARILSTGQDDGAKALTVRVGSWSITAGDPTLLAAMAVEKKLNAEAVNIPDNVDLSAAHFGELSAALLRSVDKTQSDERATLARNGIDNLMQHRLKALELTHAVAGPGFGDRVSNVLAKVRDALR